MASDQLFTAEPPRRGGCGGVFFLGSGCGCMLLCLACCGLLGSGVYVLFRMASDDPLRVVEVRESIADLDVPEEFTPLHSYDLTIPLIDRRILSWVIYEGRDDRSMLLLSEFGPDQQVVDFDDLERQARKLADESGNPAAEIEVKESEKLELVIRGQPAEFILARGRPTESDEDRDYWLVTGSFAGRQGRVVLLMIVDAAVFDRQRIVELLESIK